MPDWLFGLLWSVVAAYGVARSLYRLRRGLPIRPVRSADPERLRIIGNIELALWCAFLVGGITYLGVTAFT